MQINFDLRSSRRFAGDPCCDKPITSRHVGLWPDDLWPSHWLEEQNLYLTYGQWITNQPIPHPYRSSAWVNKGVRAGAGV